MINNINNSYKSIKGLDIFKTLCLNNRINYIEGKNENKKVPKTLFLYKLEDFTNYRNAVLWCDNFFIKPSTYKVRGLYLYQNVIKLQKLAIINIQQI